jgi:hypothetical protein
MTLDHRRVMISKLSRSTLASVLKEQYRGMLFVATMDRRPWADPWLKAVQRRIEAPPSAPLLLTPL